MTVYDLGEIVSDIRDVPGTWIYKHYYTKLTGITINQPFDGRIIKVKSIVSRDTIPSLCFFYKSGSYYWKDFSNGQGGDTINFVSYHFNKTYGATVAMIMSDYENYINTTGCESLVDEFPLQVQKAEFEVSTDMYHFEDLAFWENHKINLNLLNRFKIKKVPEYTIKKGGETFKYGGKVYGFFNENGCYQLYQPFLPKTKYLYIDSTYLIGSEQLQFGADCCGIVSGLKDLVAISAVDIRCEYVAPTSENTLLSGDKIDWLKSKYSFVFTMFDNDEAGIRAMRLYQKVYGLKFVHIRMTKDLAQNNIKYSLDGLKYHYTIAIDKQRK